MIDQENPLVVEELRKNTHSPLIGVIVGVIIGIVLGVIGDRTYLNMTQTKNISPIMDTPATIQPSPQANGETNSVTPYINTDLTGVWEKIEFTGLGFSLSKPVEWTVEPQNYAELAVNPEKIELSFILKKHDALGDKISAFLGFGGMYADEAVTASQITVSGRVSQKKVTAEGGMEVLIPYGESEYFLIFHTNTRAESEVLDQVLESLVFTEKSIL